MHLYANIEAEKLTDGRYTTVKKGQGSNKQINMFINIGSQEPRFSLFITKQEDGTTTFMLTDNIKPFPSNLVFEEVICDGKHENVQAIIACPACSKDIDRLSDTKGETCNIHGKQFIECHKLDGHYTCRACIVDQILTKGEK